MFLISQKFRTFSRIIIIAGIALLLLLSGFESLPLAHYGTTYLQNADAQRVRSQVLVKSAFILAYRPTAERPQAISDMQVTLPLFIQEQTLLTNNPNPDVQQSAINTNADYAAIVSATQKILAQPITKPVDPVQVDILCAHNRDFLINETQTISIIQAHEQSEQFFLFMIEVILDLLLLFLAIGFLVVFELVLKRQQQDQS